MHGLIARCGVELKSVDNCIIRPATYLALNRQERLDGISEEWWIAIELPVPAADYVF